MPALLTDQQIHQIRQIIERHHTALLIEFVGPSVLSPAELQTLEQAGIEPESIEAIRNSYLHGQLLSRLESVGAANMSFDDFQKEVQKQPIELSAAEQLAVEAAQHNAATYIRHLGANVVADLEGLVFQEDQVARAELIRRTRDNVAESVAKREGLHRLRRRLGEQGEGWERDWTRVAMTELHGAHQQGVADGYAAEHSDPWVFKRPMPDACQHCLRLHIGPDGTPRIYRLSTLQDNGTNVGRKAAEWRPVVGTVHPHCQCVLSRVPTGWGFDEAGDLVPGGLYGVRHRSEEEAEKSQALEDRLQKAFEVQARVDYRGLPIAIEHPAGAVRPWVGKDGQRGTTKMIYPYGYVVGTVGADGDEYDVFLGPDPMAESVYVMHQNREGSDHYDEDKAMVGFGNVHQATAAYLAHYTDPSFLGSVSIVPFEEFRAKVFEMRTMGSFQQDGMVKSISAQLAASSSVMGRRPVTGTGDNFFNQAMPRDRAETYAGVQIPVESLVDEEAVRWAIRRFHVPLEVGRRRVEPFHGRPEKVFAENASHPRPWELAQQAVVAESGRNREQVVERIRQRYHGSIRNWAGPEPEQPDRPEKRSRGSQEDPDG